MTEDTGALGRSIGKYGRNLRPSSALEGTHEETLRPIAAPPLPGSRDAACSVRRAIRLHRSRVGLCLDHSVDLPADLPQRGHLLAPPKTDHPAESRALQPVPCRVICAQRAPADMADRHQRTAG